MPPSNLLRIYLRRAAVIVAAAIVLLLSNALIAGLVLLVVGLAIGGRSGRGGHPEVRFHAAAPNGSVRHRPVPAPLVWTTVFAAAAAATLFTVALNWGIAVLVQP